MLKLISAAAVVSLAGIAAAEQVCYNSSFELASTNWSDAMVLPKFDPALGALDSVSWTVAGHVEGSASFESLDAQPATVTTLLQARISLLRPDHTPLQIVLPVVSHSDSASAFDGTIDFAGTSGKSYSNLSADQSGSDMTSLAADLAAFTAAFNGETISLPVTAIGDSRGTGAGNLLLLFRTFAATDVSVCYNYHAVPAPAAAGVLGLGGLVAGRRRR